MNRKLSDEHAEALRLILLDSLVQFEGWPASANTARQVRIAARNAILSFLHREGYSQKDFEPEALDLRVIVKDRQLRVIDGFTVVPPGWRLL